MANEMVVPILPCRDIDEVSAFYQMLGFTLTHHQTKPNPYIALKRDDIELHFAGIDGFDPAESYGNCVVMVPDTRAIFDDFAAGMRAEHGKLLVSGIPRTTRPRARKNTGAHTGFMVVDPGGNCIRFFAQSVDAPDPATEELDRVGKALQTAVVLGDSKGDIAQAIRVLRPTLERHGETTSNAVRLEATTYLAELTSRLGDGEQADALIAQARAIPVADADRDRLSEVLESLSDLEEARRN